MIKISLNEIREKSPCESGWKKVLASKGGKSADMDAQFPMTDILESNDLDDALWCLRCRPEYSNLWRKYAVWCARQVQHLMTDNRSIAALDVAWRHADDLATDAELAAAWGAAGYAARGAAGYAAWYAAVCAAGDASRGAAGYAGYAAWDASRGAGAAAWAASRDAARAAQKAKLIQILTAGQWVDATAQEGEG